MALPPEQAAGLRRILFAFGLSQRGESLLRISHRIAPGAGLQALHFLAEQDLSAEEISFRMAESFEAVRALTDRLGANTMFVYRQTGDITASILDQARSFHAELLLVGSALGSVRDPLGGRVTELMQRSPCPIGISTGHVTATNRIIILCEASAPELCLNLFAPAGRAAEVTVIPNGMIAPETRARYPQFRFKEGPPVMLAADSCDLLVVDIPSWNRYGVPDQLPALIVAPPVSA